MADDADIELVYSGEMDLTKCDFSSAKLENLNLPGRDFSESIFASASFQGSNLSSAKLDGVTWPSASLINCDLRGVTIDGNIYQVDFRFSDLRGATFRGLLTSCLFEGADLRSADFSKSHLSNGVMFSDARIDKTTNFHGAQMMRAIAREAIFSDYRYQNGALHRIDNATHDDGESDQSSEVDSSGDALGARRTNTVIARQLNAYREPLAQLAESLRISIYSALEQMVPPNDPDQLDRYEEISQILREVAEGLGQLTEEILAAPKGAYSSHELNRATSIVRRLRLTVDSWLSANHERFIDYGGKTALLGAGSAFLTFCGAPSVMAFPAVAFMLEGEKMLSAIKGKSNNSAD